MSGFFIKTLLNGFVLDLALSKPPTGAGIVVNPKNQSDMNSQLWSFDGGFIINKANGYALDIDAKSSPQWIRAVVNPRKQDGAESQQWFYEGGFVINKQNGYVLDIAQNRSNAGAPVIAYPRKPGQESNQQWTFERADPVSAQKVYLEFSDGKSHKFYEVDVAGAEVKIRYGRIGDQGKTDVKTHSSPAKAQAEAEKKINEKLKKGYSRAVMGGPEKRIAAHRIEDISQFARKAWKPIVDDGDGSLIASKFSGKPWLAKGETWPICPFCSEPMQLFLQLNLSELPEAVRGEFGYGLLQMFYHNGLDADCEGNVESAVVFYGRCAYLAQNALLRLVQPDTESSDVIVPVAKEEFYPFKLIVGWQEFEDYPNVEELTCMLCGWDEGIDHNLWDGTARRFGHDLGSYEDHYVTHHGDKLAGYPAWVQSVEYPGCPICKEIMRLVFQIESEDNLPYIFGDVGTGHIFQCKTHKDQLAFSWACS